MLNQLNEVSSTMIGIISIALIAIILFIFLIIGFKRGLKSALTNFLIFAVSITLAVLLAKPLLSLFDKMFGFSMVFFNTFMIKFGEYQSLNIQVNSTNYLTAVVNFKNSDIAISSTLKNFLSNVFDNSSVRDGTTTTLGAVASNTISYMVALFVVGFVLFIVIFTLCSFIFRIVFKKFNNSDNKTFKPIGAIINLIEGFILNIVLIITMSSLPVFGLTTDYLANGFESTKVLNEPYQFIINTEQSIYLKTIDFNVVNSKASQSKDNLAYGNYTNSDITDAEFSVSVTITLTDIIENYINNSTHEIGANTYTYILTNNTMYLYKDNKLQGYWKYNFSNNSINYKTTLGGKTITYELK